MTVSRRTGFFLVLVAAIGYAFLPIFTRSIYATSDLRPTDVAIWRFMFATPIIWGLLFVRDRVTQQAIPTIPLPRVRLLLLGTIYSGAALAAFAGLQYVSASVFIVLFYTYPAMVAVISAMMGKRLPPMAWFALALTLIGAYLTVPDLQLAGENASLGIIIALINALIVAVYFLLVGEVMKKLDSPSRASAWVITGTLITLLFLIPFFGLILIPNWLTFFYLFGLAFIATALPILLTNIGIGQIGAAQTSILMAFEPVGTMILAVPLLGETILPIQWVGSVFIVVAVILLEARNMRGALRRNRPQHTTG